MTFYGTSGKSLSISGPLLPFQNNGEKTLFPTHLTFSWNGSTGYLREDDRALKKGKANCVSGRKVSKQLTLWGLSDQLWLSSPGNRKAVHLIHQSHLNITRCHTHTGMSHAAPASGCSQFNKKDRNTDNTVRYLHQGRCSQERCLLVMRSLECHAKEVELYLGGTSLCF